jgi:hypothetical protein
MILKTRVLIMVIIISTIICTLPPHAIAANNKYSLDEKQAETKGINIEKEKYIGKVIAFDGNDAFETPITEKDVMGNDFSISFLFQIKEFSTSYQSMILSNRDEIANYGKGLFIGITTKPYQDGEFKETTNGTIRIGFGGGCIGSFFESPNNIQLNKWYDVTITFKYNQEQETYLPELYINGVKTTGIIINSTCSGTHIISALPANNLGSALPFTIGYEPAMKPTKTPTYHFEGQIDKFKIYEGIKKESKIRFFLRKNIRILF